MFVKLRKNWFDPDGNRHRVEDNPHEIPDEWKEFLPSTAEVVGKDRIVEVERKTADNSIVIEEQVIDGDVALADLDGKAGDPENPSEVKLPTATVKTPAPMMKPEKK